MASAPDIMRQRIVLLMLLSLKSLSHCTYCFSSIVHHGHRNSILKVNLLRLSTAQWHNAWWHWVADQVISHTMHACALSSFSTLLYCIIYIYIAIAVEEYSLTNTYIRSTFTMRVNKWGTDISMVAGIYETITCAHWRNIQKNTAFWSIFPNCSWEGMFIFPCPSHCLVQV